MLWLLFPFDCLFYDCLFYQQSSFNSMGERGHFFFALAWPTYPLIVHITKLSPINQNENFSLTMTMLPSLIADWGVKSLLTKIGATLTYALVVTWYLTVSNADYWYIGTSNGSCSRGLRLLHLFKLESYCYALAVECTTNTEYT